MIHPAPKAAEVRNFTRTLLRVYVSLIGERKSVHESLSKMRREEANALGEVRYRWKVNVNSIKIVLG